MLLQHIYGSESPLTNPFASTVRLFDNSYDSWSTTDWSSGIPTTTLDYYTPNTTTMAQTKTHQVAFLGDVNFSHSHEPTNLTPVVRTPTANGAEETPIQLEIVKNNNDLVLTINIPPNNHNISGTQFKVFFDETKLNYINAEYSNESISNYSTERSNYINIGSFSSDGSKNINNGAVYTLSFKLKSDMKSTLGLLGLKFYELVTKEGKLVNLIVE